MAKVDIAQLKNWFKNGLKPAQEHFWNWMDSYWHKDEKIPQNQVDGLDEYFNTIASEISKRASVDASNLSNENVEDWKEKLGVTEVLDKNVQITVENDYLKIDEGDSQADFNAAVVERIISKLDTPEDTDTPSNFPFAVLVNEAGKAAKVDATELGKNIGNTNMELDEPRKLDTNGNPFSIENLPDKSGDATFTDFLGKSQSGQMAKVGYQAFKKQVEGWTEAQKIEYGQILNGGFSTGGISVNMISPPVFEKENNDLYIVLRGLNLNLHPTDRKIEILRASDNTVLAEVPNSQIQTYASGVELIFYYNFNTLGEGVYKLKITSGAVNYVTTLNFQVVAEVTQIDLSTNSFDIITSYENTLSFATNNAVLFENEIEGTNTSTPIFSAKSDEFAQQGDNWYLEVSLNLSGDLRVTSQMTTVSVGYSNQSNSLLYTGLNSFGAFGRQLGTNIFKAVRVGNVSSNQVLAGLTLLGSIIFIKQGNLLTTIFNDLVYSETISNNSGYSLFFQVPNRQYKETTSIQIIKAYKY